MGRRRSRVPGHGPAADDLLYDQDFPLESRSLDRKGEGFWDSENGEFYFSPIRRNAF